MKRNLYEQRVLDILLGRDDGVSPSELAKKLGGSIHLHTFHLLALVRRGDALQKGDRFYPVPS